MTLNCLTCRTNSEKFSHDSERYRKICCISCSGTLASPPYEQIREPVTSQSMQLVSSKKVKKVHRRFKSTSVAAFEENTEPRLVRSAGMRRDWSFEDLRQRNALR